MRRTEIRRRQRFSGSRINRFSLFQAAGGFSIRAACRDRSGSDEHVTAIFEVPADYWRTVLSKKNSYSREVAPIARVRSGNRTQSLFRHSRKLRPALLRPVRGAVSRYVRVCSSEMREAAARVTSADSGISGHRRAGR